MNPQLSFAAPLVPEMPWNSYANDLDDNDSNIQAISPPARTTLKFNFLIRYVCDLSQESIFF